MSCAAFTILAFVLAHLSDQSKVNGLFIQACGMMAVVFFVIASYGAWKKEHDLYQAELLANEPDVLLSFRHRWSGDGRHEKNSLIFKNAGRGLAADVTLVDLGIEDTTAVVFPVSIPSLDIGEEKGCYVEVRRHLTGSLGESICEFFSFIDQYDNLPMVVKTRFSNRLCTKRYVRTFSVHRDGIGGINFTPVTLEIIED
jgi:hypothetical protein